MRPSAKVLKKKLKTNNSNNNNKEPFGTYWEYHGCGVNDRLESSDEENERAQRTQDRSRDDGNRVSIPYH